MKPVLLLAASLALAFTLPAQTPKPTKAKPKPEPEVSFPPVLPGGKEFVTDTAAEFLRPPATLLPEVSIAKTAPKVDFGYFPGQTYRGNPWSNWGDSLFAKGKYYASIGDHLAPSGTAFIYEFDPVTKKFRQLVDVKKLLGLPAGRYTPGKIHTQLVLARDGWIYCGTHRGGTRATDGDKDYQGDWLLRVHPASGKAEIVAEGPVPGHCIPTGFADPQRLIFYGGTEPETRAGETNVTFFAYDLAARKMIWSGFGGPARAMMFSPSTGRVWFNVDSLTGSDLVRFDPAKPGKPMPVSGSIGLRAASDETPQGIIYTVSHAQRGGTAELFAFHTRIERIESLGSAAIGTNQYITTLDADATGRFVYYVPGAHGGSEADNSAVVQYDTKTKTRKVIAFLHPFYTEKYGVTPRGTYSVALDAQGETLYITWNCSRGTKVWDCCALTVIHIPTSERRL
ncbi:MAG: hypothetical protein EB141_05865 [Verrucomicrobia bacterium]|nr:hypothetical protein [Verrucomicrobiota bacterium]NBU09307.1 hypothetical protein [Pseudomonadota bacterium]NDA66307.1 hypothetical protein [Verrucomicrobiota bacterium]NDB75158.1 hypothetical protein [Verrucomicrobiota bacterium]NDD38493.1 hypothetical protein [Verrucomicrobiota bacterium]